MSRLAVFCLLLAILVTFGIPAILDIVIRCCGGLPVIFDLIFGRSLGLCGSLGLSLLASNAFLLLGLLGGSLGLQPCTFSGFGESLVFVDLKS